MGHIISNLYNYYQLNTVKSENLQTLFAISACFVTPDNDKVTNLTGYTNADAFAGVKVGLFKKQVTNYEIITVELGI